jgi:hypothetical protein
MGTGKDNAQLEPALAAAGDRVTLRQALIWVTYGLKPVSPALEQLLKYPRWVGNVGAHPMRLDASQIELRKDGSEWVWPSFENTFNYSQFLEVRVLNVIRLDAAEIKRLEVGQQRLALILVKSIFRGQGSKSVFDPNRLRYLELSPDVPHMRAYFLLSHEYNVTEIPPEHWHSSYIHWTNSCIIKPPASHGEPESDYLDYINVTLSENDLYRIFPPAADVAANESTSQPTGTSQGRNPVYNKTEFLRLLAHEVATNDLPDTQAKLVKRIQEMLAVAWGEDKVPGETWLKEQISALYHCRAAYDEARRRLIANED